MDTYPELFAHRIRKLEAGEHRVPLPHDVVHEITNGTQRVRRGLIKLGQRSQVAQIDADLAARKPASRGEAEVGVAEFNRAA